MTKRIPLLLASLLSILFLQISPPLVFADLGLDSKDFGHKQVSGKRVDGTAISVNEEDNPSGNTDNGPGNHDDTGGIEGPIGDETPTCQQQSGNGQTEGSACSSCQTDSVESSCNTDICAKVYSHVNLINGEYQDDIVDMQVKVSGGNLKVYRLYAGERWLFEHQFNRLDLTRIENGIITKSKLLYEQDDDGHYHYRTFTIKEEKGSFRWENKWGDYVLYDQKGRMVETGNRLGRFARYEYENDRLVSILDKKNSSTFHFGYTKGKITEIRDEHDRKVQYSWDGDKLISVTDVLGNVTSYTYDKSMRLTSKSDETGRKFFIAYHNKGGVKSVLSRLGGGSYFTYKQKNDSGTQYAKITSAMSKTREYWFTLEGETKRLLVNGKLIRTTQLRNEKKRITDELGNHSSRTYDKNDNLTREEFRDGSFKLFDYDSANNLISATDENGVEDRFSYDERGLKISSRVAYGTPEEQLTEYTYDDEGYLTTQTNYAEKKPLITKYTYDEYGNLTTITDAIGGETKYRHDFQGNVIKATDPSGLSRDMSYDNKGNLLSSTLVNKQQFQFLYDAAGRRREIRDNQGVVAQFKYDYQDNILEQIDALGGVRKYNYDKDNRLTKKVDEEGKYSVFFYDSGSERISKIIDAHGNEINLTYREYENCGNCKKTFSSNPILIEYPTFKRKFSYDFRGRVIEKSDIFEANVFTESFAYDNVGNLLSFTDKAGRKTQNRYDSLGRLVSTIDPKGGVTRMEYNERGNIISLSNAKNQQTRFEYDEFGRKVKEIRPQGNTFSFSYDSSGRLRSRTDSNGQQISYLYNDSTGYLDGYLLKKNETDFPGEQVNFKYDGDGRLSAYEDSISSATYSYDKLGRKIEEQINYGGFSASHTYDYYRNGKKKSYRGPDEITHNYSYNAINGLEKIDIENVGSIDYADFKWMQPESVSFPGGQRQDRFDGLLRLIERKTQDIQGKELHNIAYSYNETGITSKSSDGFTTGYIYDDLKRLVEVQRENKPVESYQYDEIGNRISTTTDEYKYDNNNHLIAVNNTTYQYDQNGSPTLKTSPAGEETFTYNLENRLEHYQKAGIEAQYFYDPFGRRIAKEVNGERTWFHYSDEGLVAEFDQGGVLQTSYAYRPGSKWTSDPIMTSRATGHYFYHNDHLGAPNRLTDVEGKIVWQASYDPFGGVEIEKEEIVNNLRLPGQLYDSETGFYYNWNRYYDPDTGRYITADPIGFRGGLNLYGYVGGNPLNWADPLGLKPERTPAEPAPPGLIGTCEYYIWRADDFEKRNKGTGCKTPTYYLNYGYKYCAMFRDKTRPDLSPKGQQWLDKTLILLQVYMEKEIAKNPLIEYDDEKFSEMAFETHPPAYWDAGFHDISIEDKIRVGLTPDIKEWLSGETWEQAGDMGAREIEAYADDFMEWWDNLW